MARTANQILETQLGKLLIRLAELESVCEKQAEEIAALKNPTPTLAEYRQSTTQTATGG